MPGFFSMRPFVLFIPVLAGCVTLPMGLSRFPVSKSRGLAAAGMIRVAEVDPTIQEELIYKTAANFTGKPVYPQEMPAMLRPETAQRLARANALVARHGYRLKLWDAYRPHEVQIHFYEASGRNDLYVANPHNHPSQHSCGTAVDVTLVRADGRPVRMPTGYDDFTPAAASAAVHPDPQVRRNLKILQDAMRAAGFYMLAAEWWHYIDGNYRNYPEIVPWERIRKSF